MSKSPISFLFLAMTVWVMVLLLSFSSPFSLYASEKTENTTVKPVTGRTPVRVVYFTPADCEPYADREVRLGRVMKHVQDFYRRGMEENGYGSMTFDLEWTAPDKLKIYDVRGKKNQLEYGRDDARVVRNEVHEALLAEGIDFQNEFVVIFERLLRWEDGKATEIGPYVGGGWHTSGTAWVFDDPLLDADLLASKEQGGYYYGPCSVGKFNSHYIGGIAHEMGHMFSLPHACQLDSEYWQKGRSLMGSGNHSYGEELRGEGRGTFLCASSAARLAKNRAFAGIFPVSESVGWTREVTGALKKLNAEWKDGKIVLTGKIRDANGKFEKIIVSHDKKFPQGNYDAKTWVAPVSQDGEFTITITEWEKTEYELRLVFISVEGSAPYMKFKHTINAENPEDASSLAPLQL